MDKIPLLDEDNLKGLESVTKVGFKNTEKQIEELKKESEKIGT